MAAIFGGSTIVPDRVVNGFRLRRRQQIHTNPAHKTRATPQLIAVVMDIRAVLSAIAIQPNHVPLRSYGVMALARRPRRSEGGHAWGERIKPCHKPRMVAPPVFAETK